MNSYIFLCTDFTEPECFKLKLFGGMKGYSSKVKKVTPGDYLFLYNFQSKKLHGVFKATSETKIDIVPGAWDSEFPWQVRVKRITKHKPLTKSEIDSILKFNARGFPNAKLTEEQTSLLIQKFSKKTRLSKEEKSYREENPAHNQTDDGHYVRSFAEVLIDNWFFRERISHGYEKEVPIPELVICDFFIPIPNSDEYVYVEYWGKEDLAYKRRKARKQRIYKKYKLKLIELNPNDLKELDKNLRKKLKPYAKKHNDLS